MANLGEHMIWQIAEEVSSRTEAKAKTSLTPEGLPTAVSTDQPTVAGEKKVTLTLEELQKLLHSTAPRGHPGANSSGHTSNWSTHTVPCTVPFSLLADPERIPRRLYVFAEEPCKSTNTTSELCSPVFKEAQPRPLSTQFRISHKQLESVSICIWTVIIYCCNKKHPTGL